MLLTGEGESYCWVHLCCIG